MQASLIWIGSGIVALLGVVGLFLSASARDTGIYLFGLALFAFAIAAVAPPLLLDRDVGALTAMATSAVAVAANWRVMVGWAALIVLFTAAGLATCYLGLIVTWPLIGHASWHAYRDLVAHS